MHNRSTLLTVLLLAPFILGFAIALDIYVPNIPEIRDYFHTSANTIQLTVSFFILTTGIGQLIAGPLADAFGRRKVLITATSIYLAGSIASTFAPNITTLVIARMCQGLGACGMMVTCFAIVRDLFSGAECARIYSFLNSTIALSPLLAPLIGGYLALYYNWRASFGFLAFTALLILILAYFKIKESLPIKNRVTLSKDFWNNYLSIVKNRKFSIYLLCAAAGFSGFLTFFSVSPYIVIELLHVPEQHFGFYFAIIGIIFFFGSIFSGLLVKQIGVYQSAMVGAVLMTLSGITMLLWLLIFGLTLNGFMYPMAIMGIGGAILMGAGAGGAIEPFPEMAGAASALFGCCQFIIGFVVSTVVLQWQVKSTLSLGLTLFTLGFLALIYAAFNYRPCTKPRKRHAINTKVSE